MNNPENAHTGSFFLWLGQLKNKMNTCMSGFMFNRTRELEYSEQQQVIANYLEMYFSLVVVNWCRRNTSTYAMRQALEQMDSFVKAKTQEPDHPMTKYLRLFHSRYRYEIFKHIQTNPYAEQTLNKPLETTEECSMLASQYFHKNKGELSTLHKKLAEKQKSANSIKTAISGFFKKIQLFSWKRQETYS